jgi:NAD-dependent deacetylase
MKKGRLVVLSGAGISAESGLRTFRDSDGLWEEHRVEDVATPEAWERDMDLVLRFYNLRRAQLAEAQPNAAHKELAALEQDWEVDIVTQNVDDLHERGGSTRVTHLHGELRKIRSSVNPKEVQDIAYRNLGRGELCSHGVQLRPNIVWFGESVPLIEAAQEIVSQADQLIIIGTSLNVYPAAGLMYACPDHCRIYLIDPDPAMTQYASERITVITKKATAGMSTVASVLSEL